MHSTKVPNLFKPAVRFPMNPDTPVDNPLIEQYYTPYRYFRDRLLPVDREGEEESKENEDRLREHEYFVYVTMGKATPNIKLEECEKHNSLLIQGSKHIQKLFGDNVFTIINKTGYLKG